jgi:hypothetical protein
VLVKCAFMTPRGAGLEVTLDSKVGDVVELAVGAAGKELDLHQRGVFLVDAQLRHRTPLTIVTLT